LFVHVHATSKPNPFPSQLYIFTDSVPGLALLPLDEAVEKI